MLYPCIVLIGLIVFERLLNLITKRKKLNNKIEEGFQDAGEEKLAEDENVLERCNKRWEKGENCSVSREELRLYNQLRDSAEGKVESISPENFNAIDIKY